MGIPELEKAGKSVQLRRASEWMAELGERVGSLEKEVGELRGEKLDLEVCSSPYLHPTTSSFLIYTSSMSIVVSLDPAWIWI